MTVNVNALNKVNNSSAMREARLHASHLEMKNSEM